MPIKLYDKRDDVPEAQRAAAIETRDGKFAAEEVPDPALGDAGKKALQAERDRADKAERDRKAAEKERDELKLKAEAAEKGITEAELQKIRDAEAAGRKPIEEERDRVKAENRKLKLDDRVRALGVKYGWMPDRIEKAMKDLQGRVDLTEDEKGIVVKDANGNVTTETIDNFLEKTYKAEAPFFYAGSGGSGSGSDGSGGGGSGGEGTEDAVKAGKAAAAEQKKGREANALAFK
jgi:hypothetical protein